MSRNVSKRKKWRAREEREGCKGEINFATPVWSPVRNNILTGG
jgi:hypothetical protein